MNYSQILLSLLDDIQQWSSEVSRATSEIQISISNGTFTHSQVVTLRKFTSCLQSAQMRFDGVLRGTIPKGGEYVAIQSAPSDLNSLGGYDAERKS